MRILSQDGKYDFPYEKVCLEVTDSGKIFAQGDVWGAAIEDNFIEVAAYENEEKARKAMEMLHGAYMSHGMYKIMNESQRALFFASVSENEQSYLYGVFQFPQDNEIEVYP